jgi:hypothetical protein
MRAEVGNEEVEKELLRLAEIGWRVLSFDLGDKTTKQSHFRHIVWSLGTEANDLAAWVLIHQSNDLELVEFALSALAKNTPAEYYQAVTKATENPDPSIRVQAIKVLRRLAGKDTLVKLAEILSNDPNEEVRGEATSAIGELMNYSQRANREWSGSRILLVDQNAPLADELTRRGVEVCIACTEDEIRRTLERWQPHIVVCELLDLRFEQRQIINHVDEPPGLYLARLVRELAGASVPIVATSEIDPEQIVAQLAQIRAVYKRKPTTVRDFARAIESLLSTTGALEHRKSTTAATTDGSIISQDNRSIVNIGKAWAVLIGVNNYDDPFIANLGVCVNDVHAVGEMLTQQYGNVEFLTDLTPQQSPTRANILTSLSTTAQMAGEDDLILFYFSGHGVAETGESFFLSQDTRLSALKYTAVSMRDVSELLKRSVARAKVIIVDACHSGANLGKAPALMSKEFIQRVFDQAEGMAVLASCKHEQQSWEWAEKKRSVFTYYLLEALSGLSDTDKKGFVTVSDVARYVTHGVKSWAVRNRVPQTPTLQYEVSGDIVLVRYQSPGGH